MPVIVGLIGVIMALAGVITAGVVLVRGETVTWKLPATWWSTGLICASAACFIVGLSLPPSH